MPKETKDAKYSATPVPSVDSFQGHAQQFGLLMQLAEFIKPSDMGLPDRDAFYKVVSARLLEKIGL